MLGKKSTCQGLLLLLSATCGWINPCSACTDFTIPHGDDVLIATRTMEFGVDFESEVTIHRRGEKRHSQDPSGGPGLQWTAKYGYTCANVLHLDMAVDGVNEKGLSVGLLWFPGAEYQKVEDGEEPVAIRSEDVGTWLLGTCATVDEAREAIQSVKVWQPYLPQLKIAPPLHFSIHDAQGNSLCVEYINGKCKIHDNHVGVLTNAPAFKWQVENLENYRHLNCQNHECPNGGRSVHGSGLRGMPGDLTPPSRFVRVATFLRISNPVATASDGVRLAKHIASTVNIPKGAVKSNEADDVYHENYTQWVAIKDLVNRTFYFYSYDGLSLRSVDLRSVDLEPGEDYKSIPIAEGHWVHDVTEDFL